MMCSHCQCRNKHWLHLGLATLLAGLDGVNLAVGELALLGATRVAGRARVVIVGGANAGALAALLAGLNGVNLAVGELAGADALVGLAVLAETAVLYFVGEIR